MEGLQALRAEDRPHIDAQDTRQLKGSFDLDAAYRAVDPNGNRWDFGIAYQHSDRPQETVYWVELHTASDSQVSAVIRKTQWLFNWFKGPGRDLAAFERDVLWISSGATKFTLGAPQRRQMAQAGLRHVGGRLRILDLRGD